MTGITNPAEAYFKDGVWGWDGTVWRKLPLLWGYYDRYVEEDELINVAAGSYNMPLSAVPAGEVWKIEAVVAYASTANPSQIILSAIMGSVTLSLRWQNTVVAWQPERYTGVLTMKEGDYIRARFVGCILNDDLYVQAAGYKMKIAE